eukprot:6456359-Prymnesium_polylepis.1
MSTHAASREAIANLTEARGGRGTLGGRTAREDERDSEFVHSSTGSPGSSFGEAVGAPAADTEAAAAL